MLGGNEDVARMRVCVEETVFHQLLHVVVGDEVGELVALFPAQALDGARLAHTRVGEEVLCEQRARRELLVAARGPYTRAVLVVLVEALEIARLDAEIKLVARRAHELVDELLERGPALARREQVVELDDAFHDREVVGDLLDHAGTLHLDGHDLLRVLDNSAVHLGNGGGTDGRVVELLEQLVDGLAQLVFYLLFDDRGIERLCMRPELAEGIAVLARQDVGVRRGNLAELDEGGAEVLEERHRLVGGDAVSDVVLPEYLE